eukprot:TRINITY_DN11077_c0_g1_i4.p1 TRINITY_DN11077_c0_g1~~TRINITY_DN11077_c0_g1_i4.p1  ORF type:complete len:399 (-),score=87.12 TRINITY_DN11077_c0_g1_i4:259-1455(-)
MARHGQVAIDDGEQVPGEEVELLAEEPTRSSPMSRKAYVPVVLMAAGLVAVAAANLRRTRSGETTAAQDVTMLAEKPTWNYWIDPSKTKAPESVNDNSKFFCWMVMQTVQGKNGGYAWNEEELARAAIENKAGIFACDHYAVITDLKVNLNTWDKNGFQRVPEHYKPVPGEIISWPVGMADETSQANSGTFVKAWKMIVESKVLNEVDWVVKADPDTVWFVDRVRWHLSWGSMFAENQHGKGRSFVRNCWMYQRMQGPLELLSSDAAKDFVRHGMCGLTAGKKEDQLLDYCLLKRGADAKFDASILSDGYCQAKDSMFATKFTDPLGCNNAGVAAFHPIKEKKDWLQCMTVAKAKTCGGIADPVQCMAADAKLVSDHNCGGPCIPPKDDGGEQKLADR